MARRKALKIKWSLDAIARLKTIYFWYVEDYSITRAKKVVLSIRSRVRQIAKFPVLYPKFPYCIPPDNNIRYSIVNKTYWVVYEITDEYIEVLDVMHSSQNPELLKELLHK